MKILWMFDSPTAPSGFGNVTRFFYAGLAEAIERLTQTYWALMREIGA